MLLNRFIKRSMAMRKEYESPKAEKLEFDYSKVVTASGAGDKSNCLIVGMKVTWRDTETGCQNSLAGD